MSTPPVAAVHNSLSIDTHRRAAWWLAGSSTAFVLWPGSIPKFFFLGVAFWLACRVFQPRALTVGCAGFAAALYATTFLLTPVCASQALGAPGAPVVASPIVQLALLGFGCVWVRLAIAAAPPVFEHMAALRWRFALLWPLLLIAAFYLPWTADIAYGGDEHYHLKALVVSRVEGAELLGHGWFAALLLMWLGVGVWLATRAGNFMTRSSPLRWWVVAVIALAARAPWLLSESMLQDPFNQDRMLRYPGSQPWLGAWLWEFTRGNWGAGVLFGFETLRFTPVLAVFLLGLVLGQEKRWRKAPPVLPLMGALAVATIPTLLYHGTLLYLELALIPLLALLVREGRRWLLASPERLAGSNAWWAALALGFLKDTGIIAVGILWLARALVRGTFLTRRGEWSGQAALAEARVAFVTLGPGVLYLLLRSLHGSRPYQPHFENFLSAEMWVRALRAVVEQFGWVFPS